MREREQKRSGRGRERKTESKGEQDKRLLSLSREGVTLCSVSIDTKAVLLLNPILIIFFLFFFFIEIMLAFDPGTLIFHQRNLRHYKPESNFSFHFF